MCVLKLDSRLPKALGTASMAPAMHSTLRRWGTLGRLIQCRNGRVQSQTRDDKCAVPVGVAACSPINDQALQKALELIDTGGLRNALGQQIV